LIFRNANGRYQLLLLVPILPHAVDELLKFLDRNSGYVNKKIFLGILVSIFFGVQIIRITEFYNGVRNIGSERAELIEKSLNLVSKAGIGDDKTILVNVVGFNVFSPNTVVLMPENLNSENKSELLDAYKVDYVLFGEGLNNLSDKVFQDLKLIGTSKNGTNLSLYEVIGE
jgi:hypothetical protein